MISPFSQQNVLGTLSYSAPRLGPCRWWACLCYDLVGDDVIILSAECSGHIVISAPRLGPCRPWACLGTCLYSNPRIQQVIVLSKASQGAELVPFQRLLACAPCLALPCCARVSGTSQSEERAGPLHVPCRSVCRLQVQGEEWQHSRGARGSVTSLALCSSSPPGLHLPPGC